MFCANSDKNNIDRLNKEFPKALWSQNLNRSPENNGFYLWKIQISGSDITNNTKKILFTQVKSSDSWLRKFYGSDYGIARGVVYFEDVVMDLHAPFPSKRESWMGSTPFSVRLEKEIKIEKPGAYIFSIQSTGGIKLVLEDEKRIEIFHRETYGEDKINSKVVSLEKDKYKVEYCYESEYGDTRIPEVVIQPSDSSEIEW